MKTCVYTEETPRLKPGESKDTDILEAGDDIFEEMDKPDEYEIELIPKSTSQRPSLHRLAKVASHRRTSSTIDGRLARSTSMANRKSRLIVSPEPETMKLHLRIRMRGRLIFSAVSSHTTQFSSQPISYVPMIL